MHRAARVDAGVQQPDEAVHRGRREERRHVDRRRPGEIGVRREQRDRQIAERQRGGGSRLQLLRTRNALLLYTDLKCARVRAEKGDGSPFL